MDPIVARAGAVKLVVDHAVCSACRQRLDSSVIRHLREVAIGHTDDAIRDLAARDLGPVVVGGPREGMHRGRRAQAKLVTDLFIHEESYRIHWVYHDSCDSGVSHRAVMEMRSRSQC